MSKIIHLIDTLLGPVDAHVGMAEEGVAVLDVGDVEAVVDKLTDPAGLHVPGSLASSGTTEGGGIFLGDVAEVSAQVHHLMAI